VLLRRLQRWRRRQKTPLLLLLACPAQDVLLQGLLRNALHVSNLAHPIHSMLQ
jgi:hypothetical protein